MSCQCPKCSGELQLRQSPRLLTWFTQFANHPAVRFAYGIIFLIPIGLVFLFYHAYHGRDWCMNCGKIPFRNLPSEAKTRTILLRIGAAIVVGFVLLLTVIAMSPSASETEFQAGLRREQTCWSAKEFCKLLCSGEVDNAYESADVTLRTKYTQEAFRAHVNDFALQSRTLSAGFKYDTDAATPNGAVLTKRFTNKSDSKRGELVCTMIKRSGVWRVEDVLIQE